MVVFVVVLYQYRDRDNVCVVMPTLLVGKKSQSSSFACVVVEWGQAGRLAQIRGMRVAGKMFMLV